MAAVTVFDIVHWLRFRKPLVDQLEGQLLVVDVGGAVAADTPTQLPALRLYVLLHQLRLLGVHDYASYSKMFNDVRGRP